MNRKRMSRKRGMEVALLSQNLNTQRNVIFSLRMCSVKNEQSQVPLLNRSVPFMKEIVVSNDGVTKLLKGLNPSKALGSDG